MHDSIRTILFDFDGTLVFHDPDSFDIISAFLAEIGQPLDAEASLRGRRTRHYYFVDPAIREKLDQFSTTQFWRHLNRHLLEAMDVEGDLDDLAEQVTDRFMGVEFVYRCPQEGYQTLVALRARGYQLGLITNRERPDRFHDLLDLLDMRSYFDMVLASGEVGMSKPDPGIFDAALDRIGGTAEQSIYVGDNYWADVIGARCAGVKPVLFDPHHLFPEADCPILESIDDLLVWLP